MVSLLKLFLFLVPACVLLAPAVLGLTTVAQTEDDKCFSCCAYQNCPDGWQCCGCPSVCECCDEYYQCSGSSPGPYSCESPPEKTFIAALRKQHLKKSSKPLPVTPIDVKPQVALN